MAFIAARCSQCGAEIKVDDTQEKGVCEYCGTEFMTEKVVNSYNTYVTNNYDGANINVLSGKAENFLEMARTAFTARNYQEAYDYTNKCLECDPAMSEAWILKMQAVGELATTKDLRVKEILVCASKAIDCAKKTDEAAGGGSQEAAMQQRTASYLLLQAQQVLVFVDKKIFVKNSVSNAYQVGKMTAQQLADDKAYRSRMYEMVLDCLRLAEFVPGSYIQNQAAAQDQLVLVARAYVKVGQDLESRADLFGPKLKKDDLQKMNSYLQGLVQYLPQEKKAEFSGAQIKKSGCYIATAVYGSYNCSEVYVLRRFRDRYLARTFWGRQFIAVYYAISPHLVEHFGGSRYFRSFWRRLLDRLVMNLKHSGYRDTPYVDGKEEEER